MMPRKFILLLYAATCSLLIFFGSAPATAYSRILPGAGDTLVAEDDYYLEMRGMVRESKGQTSSKEQGKGLDSAEISVISEKGKILLFGYTDRKGRCQFRLPLNRKFTIAISHKGFVKKKIDIDTKVPADKKQAYSFTFDVDIFESISGLDVSVLDKPIAKVNYSSYQKNFIYDASYTNKVNLELKKMYRQYYALQQSEKKSAADTAK